MLTDLLSDLRWKSGWTTIRVLEDCGNKIIRDDKGNEHVGVVNNRGWFLCRRNVVTVFSDLSPSTQYCLGTHLMETGRQLFIMMQNTSYEYYSLYSV